MPLLEVITRTYRRPKALMRNQASMAAQTSDDWCQTLLTDWVGRGIGASHVALADHAPHLVGDYIWVLDDDDECILPTFVAELARWVRSDPDVVMVCMDHGPELGVLPDPVAWGHPPIEGRIGISAYVVRRAIWQDHADAWRSARYQSDFDFISAVFADRPKICWWGVVASRTQAGRNLGRPEL